MHVKIQVAMMWDKTEKRLKNFYRNATFVQFMNAYK
jgi:hypothetical protein